MTIRLRNPTSLGMVRGRGVSPAHANHPELEEVQFTEISFQLMTDSHGIVGYADMDVETGIGVLHHLFGLGDRFDVRLESGTRELILGDFGVHLESDRDQAAIMARL